MFTKGSPVVLYFSAMMPCGTSKRKGTTMPSYKRSQIPRMRYMTITEQDALIERWQLRNALRTAYQEVIGNGPLLTRISKRLLPHHTHAVMSSPFIQSVTQSALGTTEKSAPPVIPAAILAFLIADVRGYTFFTQSQGDEAAARLATKFAEIARSVAERWDGRLLELRGDEALLIFSSLRQSLLAALAMQARFAEATEREPELPLQVGIGVDVGEAVPVEDGYRGVALNRAARLCSLAAAGEILVTTGLVYVASKVEGVHFTEHSQAQLKGFETPVAVLRVSADQLLAPSPQQTTENPINIPSSLARKTDGAIACACFHPLVLVVARGRIESAEIQRGAEHDHGRNSPLPGLALSPGRPGSGGDAAL
jgi:class 3 adenylate cyclase